jgi:hypothetical protein
MNGDVRITVLAPTLTEGPAGKHTEVPWPRCSHFSIGQESWSATCRCRRDSATGPGATFRGTY